jgi:hypothetical protein
MNVVRRGVIDNLTAVERAFADIDYAELGVVSRKDFLDVISTHVVDMSDEQVNICKFADAFVAKFKSFAYACALINMNVL